MPPCSREADATDDFQLDIVVAFRHQHLERVEQKYGYLGRTIRPTKVMTIGRF